VILDKDGMPCSPNETGQIVHRGAGIFEGYWRNPEQTAVTLRPDPIAPKSGRKAVFTGDLGYIDAQGHLVIVGRADRQIKSMGVRVSPDEIEDILLTTGHMAEVAITSRADEMIGEMVVAFLVARQGSDVQGDLRNLKRDARAQLSPYMTPRIYHVLEALPRNSNGKVDYPALKHLAAGNLQ
jgi:long-chain acyl-CoA synthetase